jgi:hypothetical protein
MGAILGSFPLLVIPLLIYAAFALPNGQQAMSEGLASVAFTMPMASGSRWIVSWGQALIIFSVLLLFFEILKSSRPTRAGMIDNALSIVVFILSLILFIIVPGFATTEFFLILLMSLLDFLAGSVIMLFAAQRTVQYNPGA